MNHPIFHNTVGLGKEKNIKFSKTLTEIIVHSGSFAECEKLVNDEYRRQVLKQIVTNHGIQEAL